MWPPLFYAFAGNALLLLRYAMLKAIFGGINNLRKLAVYF